jgi:hypothetical protein
VAAETVVVGRAGHAEPQKVAVQVHRAHHRDGEREEQPVLRGLCAPRETTPGMQTSQQHERAAAAAAATAVAGSNGGGSTISSSEESTDA